MICGEYYLHSQYNFRPVVQNGTSGRLVCHISNSKTGYFIPDDDDGNVGACLCDFVRP